FRRLDENRGARGRDGEVERPLGNGALVVSLQGRPVFRVETVEVLRVLAGPTEHAVDTDLPRRNAQRLERDRDPRDGRRARHIDRDDDRTGDASDLDAPKARAD